MAIWVDADACPNVIKEILFRAAERVQMPMTLVANQNIRVPPSGFIRSLRVPAGFDVADNEIVRLCDAGDLVITADIPLAADVLAKGPRRLTRAENAIRRQRSGRSSPCVILWIPCVPAACKPVGRTACRSAIASSLPPSWINGCWK